MLHHRVRDFVLETGEQFLLDSLVSVMRRAVDPDTADHMEEAGVDLKDFTKVESSSRSARADCGPESEEQEQARAQTPWSTAWPRQRQ